MHFQVVHPSRALAPYIQHYWILETNKSDGIIQERVVPTGNIELMFHYRNPFYSLSQRGESHIQPRSMISGINRSWFDVSTSGESGALAVTFRPGTAANFFNLPMVELANRSIHLEELIKKEIIFVEEQLAEAFSLQARIQIVEQFLMKRFCPVAACDTNLIKQGIRLIENHKGQIRADKLAQNLFVTPKTLERKFARMVGNTPKQFIKIIRFHHVMTKLTATQPGMLTQHALENGYFDQAHFIRDFKAYSGYTPKELLSLTSQS